MICMDLTPHYKCDCERGYDLAPDMASCIGKTTFSEQYHYQ